MIPKANVDFAQPAPEAAEQRVVLHNVSWATYEGLLADLANQSSPRLTYNKGTLEIMTPLPPHERLTDIIETIIKELADKTNTEICCLRSTTFKRADFERGFEPDTCFYVQNEGLIWNKEFIDLHNDPPPDLVIEIDISHNSVNKFPIYAQLRVPEIWRHDGTLLVMYKLVGETYVELPHSLSFPMIASLKASEFIRTSKSLRRTAFIRALQDWIAEILGSKPEN